MNEHAVAIIVLSGALSIAGCSKPEPPADPVRPVLLSQVKLGGPAATAVFAGEIRPRHESDLAFRIGGKVVARNVDVGARVTRGQVLARLDPADVGLQADAQKAAATAAETELRFAQAELDRYQQLHQQKFISASALDQKRNALDVSRARHEQAQAQLAVTRNQTSYAALIAPENGVVTAVNLEAGQVIAPGQVVMKLAREDEREIAISVPEHRIDELRSARALAVVPWANPEKHYAARVREIAPAVDPATRTFAVRATIREPDPTLQWGMTANLVAQRDDDGRSALLPSTSVYRKDGQPAVWVYDRKAGSVALRAVTIGAYREDGVVVTSGLSGGEWIVAAGVHKLREGQPVQPFEPEADIARPSTPARSPT